MDYEKLHKDTIKKLHQMVNSGKITVKTACGICADFVPESEDEKIRKAAIEFVRQNNSFNYSLGISKEQVIAWIEKQGEQKSVEPQQDMLSQEKYAKAVDECIYGEQKPNPCDGCINRKGCINCENGELRETEQKPVNVDYVSGIREELLSIEDSAENIVGLTESQWVAIRAAYRLLGEYIAKEQKLADKVEPKFHEGEWIVHHGTENIYQVVAIIDNQYQLKYGDNYTTQYCKDVDRCTRLYDVTNDAKDGDVLVDEDNNIGIYKEIEGICWHSYIYLGCDNRLYGFSIGGSHIQSNTKPATKEQHDTLMKAMADAGYTFDFEKKELKMIEHKPTEWSEEDERIYKVIAELLDSWSNGTIGGCVIPPNTDRYINWLKSLKDKVEPQPKQEWSEEDERVVESILKYYKYMREEWVNWLKSLKDRYTWKPSDEQINALYDVLNPCDGFDKELVESLYNDLNKLRGE